MCHHTLNRAAYFGIVGYLTFSELIFFDDLLPLSDHFPCFEDSVILRVGGCKKTGKEEKYVII